MCRAGHKVRRPLSLWLAANPQMDAVSLFPFLRILRLPWKEVCSPWYCTTPAWHRASSENLCKNTQSSDAERRPWSHYSGWLELRFCGSSEDVPCQEARVEPHCLYTPSTRQGWGQGAWQLATVIAKTVCVPSVLYKKQSNKWCWCRVPQSDHHQQLILASWKLSVIETKPIHTNQRQTNGKAGAGEMT